MFSRLLCIGVLSLASAMSLAAEREPRSGPNPAEYLDKVAILLDLNEGQKAQVQQVMAEQREQIRTQTRTLREQAQSSGQRPDREQMRSQRLQAEKDLVDKLRPVLTDVQLKKFETLRELTAPHKHGARLQRRESR
jgi:hypothetical protein